jgi:hypothetical protein
MWSGTGGCLFSWLVWCEATATPRLGGDGLEQRIDFGVTHPRQRPC